MYVHRPIYGLDDRGIGIRFPATEIYLFPETFRIAVGFTHP
jgi:hypothetical protein